MQTNGGMKMVSMVVAILAIGAATAGMVIAAAAQMHVTHMALSAVMAMFLAFVASRENDKALAKGENASTIGAINARYMGLVWVWGAVVLVITYGSVLEWKEWWQFFAVTVVIAGLCLFFSAILNKDASSGSEDSTMLKIARYLAIAQLIGMSIAAVGLILDGKLVRYQNPRYTDWAANNVFFFGALALAMISFIAIRSHGKVVNQTTS